MCNLYVKTSQRILVHNQCGTTVSLYLLAATSALSEFDAGAAVRVRLVLAGPLVRDSCEGPGTTLSKGRQVLGLLRSGVRRRGTV